MTPIHKPRRSSLSIQVSVINALVLREIHTLYGHKTLGYIWAVIQAGFNITVYWALRTFFHFRPPHGMTTLSFLACGFLIWYSFTKILSSSMNAIPANKNLLAYPHVHPLDIIIARSIVISATQFIAISIVCFAGFCIGYDIHISDFFLIIQALILVIIMSIGLGLILATFMIYLPALQNIIPFILRFLFFISGVFISINIFSHRVGSWLLWNPILQCIELSRMGMSRMYQSPYVNIEYLYFITLLILCIGILFERFYRKHILA